jgi:hypothetical protein
MKTPVSPLPLALAAALVAGCASAPPAPAGLAAGRFVGLNCSGGKTFQARYAEDGRSVRVRAHHGSAELERRADGSFAGDGYTLTPAGNGLRLQYQGKTEAEACRPAA